jgi:hypothetical protein
MANVRSKISLVDKDRLIKCYERDGDFLTLASNLGIKKSSTWTIIRRYKLDLHQGKHGGNKMPLINEEIGEALIQFVQNNPLSTVDVMRNYLLSVCGVNVSKTVISDWLDGQCLTLKLVRDVLEDRNSPQTKETRFAYAKWMLESELRENCVFIDESGFNVGGQRDRMEGLRKAVDASVCALVNVVKTYHSAWPSAHKEYCSPN